jgi:hypothetical protein
MKMEISATLYKADTIRGHRKWLKLASCEGRHCVLDIQRYCTWACCVQPQLGTLCKYVNMWRGQKLTHDTGQTHPLATEGPQRHEDSSTNG